MEKVEFVIVGAGLSGLAAALVLAEAGAEVLVVERGDYPGSKNVTGGRLYLGPIHSYFPDLWDDAPLERRVMKERLTMLTPKSSLTVEFNSERIREAPYPSYTLLHGTFDRWFADQAANHGAAVIPGYKVDELIFDEDMVVGIVSSGDAIRSNAVIAADGALSFMTEKARLRKRLSPRYHAIGVKEVIELPSKTIEERFGLDGNEGTAQLFFGSILPGVPGGGFLYTNRESLSLGLVITLHDLMEGNNVEQDAEQPPKSPHELLEAFKARSEIRPLIAEGHPTEYSAHIIPEGGFHALPKLVTDGMVVVGDAAGFTLNMGVTVRGLDFALASGVMAAHALLRARKLGDFSAASLIYYETLLKESFVWQDLKTFQHMPDFLANPRLFELYPSVACDLMDKIMWIDNQPKEKLSKTFCRIISQNLLQLSVLKDLISLRKI